jgi:hypothetical protein
MDGDVRPVWPGLSEKSLDEIVLCRHLSEHWAQAMLEEVAAMAASLVWDTRRDRISIETFLVADARIISSLPS